MLVALKLVAWWSGTTAPGKDAADLLLILKNYLDAGNQSRLYDEAPHLLTKTILTTSGPALDLRAMMQLRLSAKIPLSEREHLT